MGHGIQKSLFLMVVIRLGFVAASCSAVDIKWATPLTGLWDSPAAWDLGTVPQNDTPPGTTYDVLIDAQGSKYFARVNSNVTVDSVLVDSDNATLAIDGGFFVANEGITISSGKLQVSGGEIAHTRIESTSPITIPNTGRTSVFNDVTLAGNVTGGGSVFSTAWLRLKDRLTLDGGSLRAAADLQVQAEGNITIDGTGQIIVGPSSLGSGSTSRTDFLEFVGTGARPVIGSDVTIRGMGRGHLSSPSTNVMLTNHGTIAADTPGAFLVVESSLRLVNNGLLTASNGGELRVEYGSTNANVGQTALLAGGTLTLMGYYTIDQAIDVPTDAMLKLFSTPTNTAGINLDGGTLRFAWEIADTTNINYQSGEVQVGSNLTLDYFASLDLPPQIAISFEPTFGGLYYLNLEGNAHDLSVVHTNWKFDGGRFRNGTLTGAPAPGHLTPNGDLVYLQDIDIDFDLDINSGCVSLEDISTIAANRTVTVGTGGTLYLQSWSSQGTIAVNGGNLQLVSSPASLGQIEITTGTLEIGTTLTASKLMQISTTEETQIQLVSGQPTSSLKRVGAIDLEGASVDLSLVAGSWNYDRGTIRNGTLTGATDLGSLGADNRRVDLSNITLAYPLTISQGTVAIAGNSTVASPIEIVGGTLQLSGNWTNNSSITVQNGVLSLGTLPQNLGIIEMNGGTLDFQFNTTLSQVNQLEVGNPSTIRVARTVNLEGSTFDLGTAGATWELHAGMLSNGTIIDSSGANPLVVTSSGGNLQNVVLEANVETAGALTLSGSTARNVTFNGAGSVEFYSFSLPTPLEATTFNSRLKFYGNLEVVGGLTLNGGASMAFPAQRPNVHFLGTQSIEGNSEILISGSRGSSSIVFTIDDTLTFKPGIKFHTVQGTLSEILGPGTLVNEGVIETDILPSGFATTNLRIDLAGLENTGTLRAKNSGRLLIEVDDWTNQGLLEVDGSTISLVGSAFHNGSDGIIQGNGRIELNGPVLNNSGELSPGFSAGSLVIDGDLQHETDGVLRIELGGDLAGHQYDQLNVLGDMELAGQLQIELIDGFTLLESDVFKILDVGGTLTGTFAGLPQDDLVGQFNGVNLYIRYDWGDGNDVALYTKPSGLAGDFDGDGDVDGRDFLAWQRGESPRPWGAGNLALWRQNYRESAAEISSTAPMTVPEPNSMAMFLLAAGSLSRKRLRQKNDPVSYSTDRVTIG
jgi:hypothetical protein